ncbi:MAG: RagB/SusD family nutrient uptake outer membrane protein [Cyclonatronaceae bacterium]
MYNKIMKNGFARVITVLSVVFLLASCDSLIDVDTPSFVSADDLENPELAALIVNGAASDFEFAFQGYVLTSAIFGNELGDATFTAARWEVDQRKIEPSSSRYVNAADFGVYTPLSTARFAADDALRRLDAWTDAQVENRAALIATASGYAGYSYLLLGEAFCSMSIDLSGELSREEIFNRAASRFERAIASAQQVGDNNVLNMARIGYGRTLLNLGRTADAANAVQNVPDGFVFNVSASAEGNRRNNRIFQQFNSLSVTVNPGYHDLQIGGVDDPRVPVEFAAQNSSGVDVYRTTKYTAFGSPIALARSAEAKLIRAEAAGGQTAVNLINELRAVHGLPDFSSNNETEIRNQVIEERRREFFLESQTLYDLTRYNLPLNPAPGSQYRDQNDTYGDQRCMPLPDVERNNNPNL